MTQKERVKKGLSLLSAGQIMRVEVDTLSMKSEQRHVLAQIFGSISAGAAALGVPRDAFADYGFASEPNIEDVWEVCLDEWAEEFVCRTFSTPDDLGRLLANARTHVYANIHEEVTTLREVVTLAAKLLVTQFTK